MVNVLRFQIFFSFCSQIKCPFSGLEFAKILVRIAKGEAKIKLLLKVQSDLYLPCLSVPFRQATNVQNYRTFTVCIVYCHLPMVHVLKYQR